MPSRSAPGILYAGAAFLSSALLFLSEPIAAKRVLPLLGGSAAVWTACLVFFQTALLLGYAGAHALTTRVAPRRQVATYLVLLALCAAQSVATLGASLRSDPTHPIASVLLLLTWLVGAPFLILSAAGPLLQAWYARSAGARPAPPGGRTIPARPYRLFAVSNAGSLLGLLAYPWFIEPYVGLRRQGVAWTIAFGIFIGLCAGIGYAMRGTLAQNAESSEPVVRDDVRIPAGHRALWVLLAASASLLLSAVTNHLSQDVAAIPLLWILPLTAYLLSFVVAFGAGRWCPRWLVLPLFALGLGSIAYAVYEPGLAHLAALLRVPEISFTLSWTIAVFCAGLFLICLFCHAELHRLRPDPRHLTEFYLGIAGGGALGAIFVGVAAPTVLAGNYELPCGLALAAALGLATTWRSGWSMRAVWLAATAATAALVFVRIHSDRDEALARVRSFYGTLRVVQTPEREDGSPTRTLYHGTIQHGLQFLAPDLRSIPTTYYTRDSGVGLALDLCCGQAPRRVGIVGLGTGTLAAYGRAGDVFRFYDINPQVEPIARSFFTYLAQSAATIEVVHGDARISMAGEEPQRYDVLAVDAFSGDAIPVHLLTAEALEVYQRHLGPSGIIAFHVSNRHLDLAPVVLQQAEHAGLRAVLITSSEDEDRGAYSSDWMLVTADTAFLARPEIAGAQQPVAAPRGLRLWTDAFNSLLPVFKERED